MLLTQNVVSKTIICSSKCLLISHVLLDGKLASGVPHDTSGDTISLCWETDSGTVGSLLPQNHNLIPALVLSIANQPPPIALRLVPKDAGFVNCVPHP